MRPLIESLDVNNTCKDPITNLKRHFCLHGEIMQIHESNYAAVM